MIPSLVQLREAAEKATAGPWEATEGGSLWATDDMGSIWIYGPGLSDDPDADAQFIAAANPETMIALLDLVDELAAALKVADRQSARHHLVQPQETRAALARFNQYQTGETTT